ncbi:LysR family transcriptional regulator [Streptosporangium sp. NPDC000396]|uniref:LysR family transcriptional regulator n=1 Tax=Streptosporangium sp. NPDC000396 TaxID=3366185 RepID=UPI0036BF4B44
MELRDIEIFLTLAEELHFGRTAERLHVSQARVSQAIKKQERQIGTTLFERTSRNVRLTPIGERLFEELRPIYRSLQESLKRATLAARGQASTLRLGIMGPLSHEIGHILGTFRSRHPECVLQIREAHFSDPFGPLRAGEVDIQMAWLPIHEPDLTVGPVILTESIVLALASDHPLADRDSVSYEDLGDCVVFRVDPPIPTYWEAAVSPWHTPSGRPIPRGPAVSTFQEMLALISAGEAVSPVFAHGSRYYVRPDVVYLPIRDAPPGRWALVWRTAGETGLVRAFAQAARDAHR